MQPVCRQVAMLLAGVSNETSLKSRPWNDPRDARMQNNRSYLYISNYILVLSYYQYLHMLLPSGKQT